VATQRVLRRSRIKEEVRGLEGLSRELLMGGPANGHPLEKGRKGRGGSARKLGG